jgi:DNA primase catalytic subunit
MEKKTLACHFYYVDKRLENWGFMGRGGVADYGKVNEINRNLTILANSGNYVFMVLAV